MGSSIAMRRAVAAAILSLSLTACAGGLGVGKPQEIAALRPPPENLVEITRDVSAAQLNDLLKDAELNRMRPVQVFGGRGQSSTAPEYRLFDLKAGSIYDVLGLQAGDILVAADGFVITDPKLFAGFIALLPRVREASIEIRRKGQPMLYKYTIEPDPRVQKAEES